MRSLFLALTLLFSLFTNVALAADPAPKAPPLDRSTPRRSFDAFANAAHSGDFRGASSLLDLRAIAKSEQAERGEELARELATVLDRKLSVDGDDLSDDPHATNPAGVHTVKIGTLRLPSHDDVDVTMALTRIGNESAWLFAPDTVDHVPALYEAFGPAWAEKYMPRWLTPRVWSIALWQWLGLAIALVMGIILGSIATALAAFLGERIARRTRVAWDDLLLKRVRGPARLLFTTIVVAALIETLRLAEEPHDIAVTFAKIGVITAVGWVLVRVVSVLTDSLEARAAASAPERFTQELNLRGMRTRVVVLRRIGGIVIGVVTASLVLLQFEAVRSVGVSILASAGLAGIVLGVAAQKTLATLLAGIQLSITQPIKIGDSVVVEDEFGTIEEINLTYVVVKTWDERRLIVPMTLFLEHPFQNWTKVSSPLTGAVLIRADFTVPMDDLRREFESIVTTHPLWDGRTKAAQVTEATERLIEVRFLVSASDSDRLFNLRCDVRERLVTWLRNTERGRYLPLSRLDVSARQNALS